MYLCDIVLAREREREFESGACYKNVKTYYLGRRARIGEDNFRALPNVHRRAYLDIEGPEVFCFQCSGRPRPVGD